MSNKTDKPWEASIILGDKALAKLLDVEPMTIYNWRKAGWITGKPLGVRSDGKPAYFTYNWKKVSEEVRRNVKLQKARDRVK